MSEHFSDKSIEKTTQSPRRFQRSEMVQEIVSSKPGFLVNYGTSIFLFILIITFIATWFIKFPDVVMAAAKFTSVNAPKEIMAKTSGRLVKLFTKEDAQVSKGDVIGFLESNTNHNDALKLGKEIEETLEHLNNNNISIIETLKLSEDMQLGELQPDYEIFQQTFNDYKNFIGTGFFIRKRKMLLKDLDLLQKMQRILLQQKSLNADDISLSQQNFNAHEQLNNEKVIADLDYRIEKSKLIGKKLSIPQINAALINNLATQNEKQKEIAQLDKEIAEQKNKFEQSTHSFISKIEAWKSQYVLSAPVGGTVKFAGFLQENQQLQANMPVCFVNPGNSNYYAELYIPQSNFGKVKTGQTVLLKLPSYPFEEYGAVKGELEFISNIPSDSGYLAKIKLINGLNTNYKKQVQFREGLTAKAEIVTKDMRLLQRMYYGIVRQVNSN